MVENFEVFEDLELLDQEARYLVHKARDAARHAYAPYSRFFVGASIIVADGGLVTGSNQENASYPLCMCGERVALYAASSQYPGKRINGLAVVAFRKGHKEFVPATPCGSCRQVMYEYEERQKHPYRVIIFGPGNKWYIFSSSSILLPFAFDKSSLSP